MSLFTLTCGANITMSSNNLALLRKTHFSQTKFLFLSFVVHMQYRLGVVIGFYESLSLKWQLET